MSTIAQLKKARTSLQNNVTKTANEIATQLSEDQINLVAIQAAQKKLNHIANELTEIDEKIKQLYSADNDVSDEIYETEVNTMDEYYVKIETALVQIERALIREDKDSERASESEYRSTCEQKKSIKSKLPTIPIPQFSGNVEEYPSFTEIFDSIMNRENLDEVLKLQYLHTALKSEPLHLIESLAVTHDNYRVAREILDNRYKNTKILVNMLLNKLINEPKVERETAEALKTLVDNFNKNLLSLKNVQKDEGKLWNSTIVHLLVTKLASHTRRDWEMETPSETIESYGNLNSFLEKRIRALSAAQSNSSNMKNVPNTVKPQTANSGNKNRAVAGLSLIHISEPTRPY